MRSVKCNSTKQIWRLVARVNHARRAQEGPKMAPTHHHSPHATDHLIGYLLLTWVPNPFGGHI